MTAWGCAACGGENPAGTRFCGHCATPNPDFTATAAPLPSSALADALLSRPGSAATERVDQGAHALDERRVVTSLFADLSGFTTLADELEDPEALHEVVAPVIGRLAAIAERYEGFIAKYAGDALLVFFGAPIAHEDDATRALLVALEMHERLPEFVAELPREVELELHIGINTGQVVSGLFGGEARSDYSILGDAVILAQRLESVAPSGETYIGASTYELVKDDFETEFVGELTLKGKLRPVHAWRVVGQRRLPSLAATDHRRPTLPLIGREEEKQELSEVLATGYDEITTVVIEGEPGVGKSRLLREARRMAAGRGMRWYQARCLSYGSSLPYWPYADLLRQVAGIRFEDGSDAVRDLLSKAFPLGDHLPYLLRLLGADDGLGELDAEAYRHGLHSAFRAWARFVTRSNPVVLAIEDCHWADPSTLDLTTELATDARLSRMVVVVATRPGSEPVDRMAVNTSAHRIQLQPFDARRVRRFLRAILGGEPPADLVRVVHSRTQGNPLFVEEVARSLQEQRVLVEERGHWRLRAGWDESSVPDSVARVVAARIDRLPPRDTQVLMTAAAIGRTARRSLLGAVLDERADLDEALARLVDAGLLDPTMESSDDAMTFHHALVQEVAYERLLGRDRQRLHKRIADIAEELYGSGDETIELLARHHFLGGDGATSIPYLLRAARRARRLFANDEAVVHLRHALSAARSDNASPGEVLVELAEVEALRGEHDHALMLLGEARAAADVGQAWIATADVLRRCGRYDEALVILDEAEVQLLADPLEIAVHRADLLALLGRNEETIAVCERALASADPATPLVGQLLLPLSRAESLTGSGESALGHGREATRLFREHGDLRRLATSLRMVGAAELALERHADAAATLRQSLVVAEKVGDVEDIAGCLLNLAIAEFGCGNTDEALACNRRAIVEFERIGHESGRAFGYSNIGDQLLLLGRTAEARGYCEKALDIARGIQAVPLVANVLHTVAGIELAEGRAESALSAAVEAAELWESMGSAAAAVECVELAADAATRCGDAKRARALIARARSLTPA